MPRSSWSGAPASAATSIAARPVLAAATACGDLRRAAARGPPRSTPRSAARTRPRRSRRRSAPGAPRPRRSSCPQIDEAADAAPARRCRGAPRACWPGRAAESSSKRSPPTTRARASAMPPTIAAEREPRPRLCGMLFSKRSRSPRGVTPRISKAARIARTTRCRSSRGRCPHPRRRPRSPARRRRPRRSAGRAGPAPGRGSRSRGRGSRWSPGRRRVTGPATNVEDGLSPGRPHGRPR